MLCGQIFGVVAIGCKHGVFLGRSGVVTTIGSPGSIGDKAIMHPSGNGDRIPDDALLRFANRSVALTGRFAALRRGEIVDLLSSVNANFVSTVGDHTEFLLVGRDGWPLQEDGRLTRALERAHELQQAGSPLEILSEDQFLAELGLLERRDAIHRQYTAVELSRVLGISKAKIRRLRRAGLLVPTRTIHRLELYDFAQAAAARDFVSLVESGVAVERIKAVLDRLATWSQRSPEGFSDGALIARGGELLFRLESGELAEATGQLRIEFTEASPLAVSEPIGVASTAEITRSGEEWICEGQRLEDAGQLQQAREAYEAATQSPDTRAEAHFHLGNILSLLAHPAEAVAEFYRAVELDSEYVEVWNHLGSVLSELGEVSAAVDAFGRAIALAPEYADAHLQLAETLWNEEQFEESRVHYHAYLKLDPFSPRAREIQAQLSDSVRED